MSYHIRIVGADGVMRNVSTLEALTEDDAIVELQEDRLKRFDKGFFVLVWDTGEAKPQVLRRFIGKEEIPSRDWFNRWISHFLGPTL
jgi:hypothetical protein